MDSSYTLLKSKLTSKLWNPRFLTVLGALYLILGAFSFHQIEKEREIELTADLEKQLEKLK